MTRQEVTHTRDLTFSGWIRDHLPDSATGYLVSDLDFILFNYKTKKIMLLEVKTRNVDLKYWQSTLFNNLARWVSKGIDSDWVFLGFHTLQFENTSFNDGKCYFDKVAIDEEELITKLSLFK